MPTTISVWEDSGGTVYLSRDREIWSLGRVSYSLYGIAGTCCRDLEAGTWQPENTDGFVASTQGLTLIANWSEGAGLVPERDDDGCVRASAAGLAFLAGRWNSADPEPDEDVLRDDHWELWRRDTPGHWYRDRAGVQHAVSWSTAVLLAGPFCRDI
jgi:hypothetical protein